MISTLENQISDGPLAVPRCLPQQGWGGAGSVPGPLRTRDGVRCHISPWLCPRAIPGSYPGSAPWLCAAPSPFSGAQRCF